MIEIEAAPIAPPSLALRRALTSFPLLVRPSAFEIAQGFVPTEALNPEPIQRMIEIGVALIALPSLALCLALTPTLLPIRPPASN